MRSIITLSLAPNIKRQMDKIVAQEEVNRSQVVQQALNDYFTKYQFQQLRRRLVKKAQAQGLYTDEDVFARVS